MSDVGMNRGIFATANGMLSAQRMMDVVANNLANVSTNGFKRDQLGFNDTLIQQLKGGDGELVGGIGIGPNQSGEHTSFEPGSIQSTGNALDVAIHRTYRPDPSDPNKQVPEDGMFAVQTPNGIRFTRDGAFHLDETGTLVNGEGLAILDVGRNPIQISQGAADIAISTSGEISARLPGTNEHVMMGELGVFRGTFVKEGANLFSGSNVAPIESPSVQSKALEGSNVNPIQEMVQMISLGRAFEMAQKSIQSQDELAQKLIQSLQDR